MSRHSSRIDFAVILALSACGAEATPAAQSVAPVATAGTGAPVMAAPAGSNAGSKPGAGTAGGVGRGGSSGSSAGPADDGASTPGLERFSFFVTSLKAMQELSGDQHGFGGDLRFGETGAGAGLRGADKICATIAEKSMPGAGKKPWRAFLSTVEGGPSGGPVHAIDRVGDGPWYDRLGRLVSKDKADLMQVRPASADPLIKNDLPNEEGVPNHNPDGSGEVDNHDVLTGTDEMGQLYADDPHVTCNDWTNSVPDMADAPRVGHSWPRMGGGGGGGRPGRGGRDRPEDRGAPDGGSMGGGDSADDMGGGSMGGGSGENWMSALSESGCGAEASIVEMGPPDDDNPTVGSGGGYGGIYCLALTP